MILEQSLKSFAHFVSVDRIPPVVTCTRGDTNRLFFTTPCRTGGTSAVVFPNNQCTATDNSGTVTLISQTHQAGQFFPVGETEVTFTYADPSGNRGSDSFFVTVTEGM